MSDGDGLSRRALLARAGLLGAAAALAPLPEVAERYGLLGTATAADDAVKADTLGGLVAFVVPGDDRYSRAQGLATRRPGGVAAGATASLEDTLEVLGAGVTGALVGVLNSLAQSVQHGGNGAFAAPFPALSYARKQHVFEALAQSTNTTLQSLAATLPAIVAFLAYSESAVLDPRTRRLTREPVGWRISGYTGVADIRDELRGYHGGHRKALP